MALASSPQQTVAVSLSTASQVGTVTIADAPAGSVLVVGWGVIGAGQVVTPSSPNTTWTASVQVALNGSYEEIWVGVVAGGTSGTTVTFTAASSNYSVINCRGWIQEWRGSNGIAYLAASTSGTSTITASPTITPVAGKNFAMIGLLRAGSGITYDGTPTNSFTDPAIAGSALSRNVWRVVASASGSYSTSETSASTAWLSAAIILYDTAPTGTFTFTTQPSSTTSGVVMSPVVVTADAAASGLTCTLTLVGPFGSITNATAVCNGAGAATFSTLTPVGDGSAYTLTAAITGYTGSASSAFSIIGTATAANLAFIAANGGDALFPAIYDARLNQTIVTAKVSAWDDAIGTYGSRTPGPQRAQGTAGNRPALTGTQGSGSEYVSYTAASSQFLATAVDARFTMTGSVPTPNPLFVLSILRANGTGPLVGIAKDETSAATYPFMMIQPTGTDWGADIGTDGTAVSGFTAGRFQPTSKPAFAGGEIRAVALGKGSFVNNTNVDGIYRFTVAGHQQVRHVRAKAATAGSCKLVSGRLGAVYGSGDEYWTAVIAFEPDAAFWRRFKAFAATFGTNVTVQARALCFSGSSIVVGTTNQPGGDTMTPIATSGTTSFPYYLVNYNPGGGTLASQLPDLASSVQAYNYGASGRNIQQMIDAFPYEVGILTADFSRVANICVEIGNSVQGLGWTAAQVLAKLTEYKALHTAAGATFILYLGIDRGAGATTGTTLGNNTGWYVDNTYLAKSTNGTVNTDVFAAIRLNPLLYVHGYIDADAATKFKINPLGNVNTACLSNTYYNMANAVLDSVHLAPAGYSPLGILGGDYVYANQGIIWPDASDVRARRRRWL